jgi:hypothetical protein
LLGETWNLEVQILSSSDTPADKRLEEAEIRIRRLESRLGRLEAILFLIFVLILIGFIFRF